MDEKSKLPSSRGRKGHVVDLEQPDNVLSPALLARYRDGQVERLTLITPLHSLMLYFIHGELQSVLEQGGTLTSSQVI